MPFPARLNNGQELLQFLTGIKKYYVPTTSPTVDTLGAALAVDATDINVTTFASWATGDHVITYGSGGMERIKLGTKPGSGPTIPLTRPAALAQPNGSTIKKAVEVDLGYIEDAGGTLAATKSKTAVGAANSRSAIAYIDGDNAEPMFSWSQRESNLRNIVAAYGGDEDAIKGTGTSTDPYRILIGRSTIGTQANYCLLASGLYVDGRTVNFDLWNCAPEIQVSAQVVGKGQPTVWGMSVKYTDMLVWIG